MLNKTYVIITFLLVFCLQSYAQEEAWIYIKAKDTSVHIPFIKKNNLQEYTGNDPALKAILDNYLIRDFKKTLKFNTYKNRNRRFFIRANSAQLLEELVATDYFISGEIISEEDKKIYEPNDYGLTSTIGENLGLPVNLDYLDYMGLPQAWYYTTGSRDVIIAIADGSVDTTDIDFKGKTRVLQKSNLAKGHGIAQAGNAAAQGDNAHGIPGICYDCSIYGTNYGDFKNFKMLKEAAREGAKVINCSWVGSTYYESGQQAIDSVFNSGTLIVASSGNKDWTITKGERLNYPASYKNVISVSSGMHREDGVTGNIQHIKNKNSYYVKNIAGFVGRTAGFKDGDTLNDVRIYPVSTSNLNKEVDLLAPTVGLFSFGEKILNDTIWYSRFETTSGASPSVSGTIGLMYSLNPKLPHDEVESILKIAATNIDHIPANKPYKGYYGAGILHAGRSVKLVHDLYTETATASISNQDFSRWDFKITAYSEKVVFENQIFRDNATLNLVAKNQIVLKPGTHLKPNYNGSVALKIDTSLEKECELRLRENGNDK